MERDQIIEIGAVKIRDGKISGKYNCIIHPEIEVSLFYLTSDWTRSFFETDKQFLTSYFVLFIASALFNGFNVRDDGFRIFGHLKENPDFLKVFFLILFIQFAIINVSLLPVKAFTFISAMFRQGFRAL